MTVDELLSELRRQGERLNQKTDQATKELRGVEEQINSALIGIEIWLQESERDFEDREWLIGYGRTEQGWGLRAILVPIGQNEAVAIVNTPRVIRLRTLCRVPEILEKLHGEAVALTEQLEQASREAAVEG